ncbi:putative membrane protein YjcC [Candidatus Izimaplasma bacterium HR1]|uniref:EAL domain-containing protein n=1 Tax=Candidatus Izimoplasma sp. HR1 TaxID=1541959 RepID=UPI0004F74E2F|nr:putative membrane protein YjcC [Candidatus Izimaplasma bacterium HR1]
MARSKQIYIGIILLLALSIISSIFQHDYIVTFLSAFGIGLITYQLRVNEDVKLVIAKNAINRKYNNKDVNNYFVVFLQITNLSTYSQFYDINLSDYIMEKTYKLLKKRLHNNVFLYSADQIVIINEFENKTVINQLLRTNEQIEKTKKILNYINRLRFSPNNNLEYYQAKVIGGTGSNGMRDQLTTIESIIKLAHFSMLKAKKENKDLLVATEETRIIKEDIDSFNQEIEKGIEFDEFNPHFLPIFDTNKMKIVGCESLLRWEKNEYRIIEAAKFKDIANEKNLFGTIDRIILEKSFKSYQSWLQKDLIDSDFTLTINLAKQSLESIQINELISLTDKYKIKRKYIEFDISEQDLVSDQTLLAISKIKAAGYKVSIDAFYASSSNLRSLINIGFDTLKLSRTSLPTNDSNETEYHLYESLIKFSRLMGYKVMSKGIENKYQLEIAKELKPDLIQGYYFTPPLNDMRIRGFLNKYRSGILV